MLSLQALHLRGQRGPTAPNAGTVGVMALGHAARRRPPSPSGPVEPGCVPSAVRAGRRHRRGGIVDGGGDDDDDDDDDADDDNDDDVPAVSYSSPIAASQQYVKNPHRKP